MSNIVIASANDQAKWNEFVLAHPQGNYCHLYEWQNILKESYNLSSLYMMALEDNNLVALLPMTRIKNIKLKKMGVSVAFNGYGGILSLPTNEAINWEEAFSDFLFKNTKISQIEIRQLEKLCEPDKLENTSEVSMILDLPGKEEELWKSIGSKVRNQIRKAEKAGVQILENDDINGFYNIYAKNVGRLGTPVHKRLFFKKIKKHFKDQALYLTATYEDKIIGGMLLIDHQKTSADPFASTLSEFNQYCPNMLMYWHAIKRAQNKGLKFFDMGRSQLLSGTYKFKKQWGANPYNIQNKSISKNTTNTDANIDLYRSDSMKKLSTIWAKLPSALQNTLGPCLRKYLP